ncbi:hypothetical protein L837_4865 [Mycobacterium avium MAV_061107_1842]|nr:hypothetical protein L837_4865 [Mycobacterium avium MAV_061107_1842]
MMANTTTRLTDDALAFLSERHLAMLTTLRADNSPHVVAVGFTFDPKTHIARVITTGGSQKAINADRGGLAVLSQVDGARWLSLEGRSKVNSDVDAVRDAELRYASATARRGPTRDGWSSKCKSSGCSGRRIYWTGARSRRQFISDLNRETTLSENPSRSDASSSS